MIKQRAISTKISITKKGEVKFFQVKIPFDAISITGIETAMRIKNMAVAAPSLPSAPPTGPGTGIGPFGAVSPPPPPSVGIMQNSLAGELKLQSKDDSNVFYATSISDTSAKEGIDKAPQVNFISENVWTHGYKRQLEEILVDANTTVINGFYRDKMSEMLRSNASSRNATGETPGSNISFTAGTGAAPGGNISYDVFIYLWYKYESK